MTTTTENTTYVADHDVETVRLINEFKAARRAQALWKTAEDELRDKLLKIFHVDHFGHWQATVGGRAILKIDSSPVRRFDTLAFRTDHPDLYESYRTEIVITKVVTAGTAESDDSGDSDVQS